jgi:hypothetical protein
MTTAIGASLRTVVSSWTRPPARAPSRLIATNSQIRLTAITAGDMPPNTGSAVLR